MSSSGEIRRRNFKNKNGDEMKKRLFCYATTVQTIATTVSVTPQIVMSNDAPFEMCELRASVRKVAAFDGSLLLNLSLSNGDKYSNVAIDILSFASAQQNEYSGIPIRFPVPTWFDKNSKLDVQLTNNNGADVFVQIQLWGYKVFQD